MLTWSARELWQTVWLPDLSSVRFTPSTKGVAMRDDMYNIGWVITMPSEGKFPSVRYKTIGVLSPRRGDDMDGNETVVWLAREIVEDGNAAPKLKEGPPVVIKQAWSRVENETEHDLLPRPLEYVYRVVRSLKMDLGSPTFRKATGAEAPLSNSESAQLCRNSRFEDSESTGTKRKRSALEPLQEDKVASKPVGLPQSTASGRVLVRTVMDTYGWSLKYAKDLEELVRVIRDAIQGHRNLYFSNVLHRDISEGNIIISPKTWSKDGMENTVGVMIDLGHAKRSQRTVEHIGCDADTALVDRVVGDVKLWYSLDNARELASILLRRFRNKVIKITCYLASLKDCCELNGSDLAEELNLMCDNFVAWEQEMQTGRKQPSWSEVHATQPEIAGTPAFMSYEILAGRCYSFTAQMNRQDLTPGSRIPIHSSIHDIESFFWVLVYHCLVRAGPGGAHRTELDPKVGTNDIKDIVYTLFEAEESRMSKTKREVFECTSEFQSRVVDRFHSYFAPLKPLVLRWRQILMSNYIVSDDIVHGTIHEQVLRLLDKTLKDHLHTDLKPPIKATEQEVQRRISVYAACNLHTAEGIPPDAATQLSRDPQSPSKDRARGFASGHESAPASKRMRRDGGDEGLGTDADVFFQ
ncbi:hypothetical protein BXZ70DRAFT_495190 [Cristinia sonorae]|uniref:Fungal-type protein kinase domain-containing protein n=1 Tax=Cristinia sonorae TaxID=1940300 RepID=A0A8K0UGJ5_9AGAR|nr:hypothetical protein BXZ70DRAFT_495190 [Cristinia sonorae]